MKQTIRSLLPCVLTLALGAQSAVADDPPSHAQVRRAEKIVVTQPAGFAVPRHAARHGPFQRNRVTRHKLVNKAGKPPRADVSAAAVVAKRDNPAVAATEVQTAGTVSPPIADMFPGVGEGAVSGEGYSSTRSDWTMAGTSGAVPNLPEVAAPVIDKFELVASDGDGTYIWNLWGLHQPRITHHADGTIRLIYSVLNENGGDAWRVMKKPGDDGTWSVEASGNKFDDVFLLRDPVTDVAHVIASPDSVRTIYSSPAFAPVVIPGAWKYSDNDSRQYSGAGMAPDGTLCFKNFEETPTPIENAITHVAYICGSRDSAGLWEWRAKTTRQIGVRYAYDYLFPGAQAGFGGFLATAQHDTHRISAGWPNAADTYIFDGVRFYKTGYASHAEWLQSEIVPPHAPSPAASAAPVQVQQDAFIDSQNRVIVNSYREDPADASVRGLYLAVADANGNMLLDKKWNLPPYGNVRVFESFGGRLWLLWTNSDSRATSVHLYPVTVMLEPALDLQISSYTDLSASAWPYNLRANVFLAVPRGGNQKNNFIDGMMVACDTTYPAACGGRDKLLYFRIRLPH